MAIVWQISPFPTSGFSSPGIPGVPYKEAKCFSGYLARVALTGSSFHKKLAIEGLPTASNF